MQCPVKPILLLIAAKLQSIGIECYIWTDNSPVAASGSTEIVFTKSLVDGIWLYSKKLLIIRNIEQPRTALRQRSGRFGKL